MNRLKLRSIRYLFCGSILFSSLLKAVDKPGGLAQTAVNQMVGTYEVLMSPAINLNSSGAAYFSSELRYQPSEDLGLGLGFGAGQTGFHLGAQGTWYIAPDLATQPALALVVGTYFTRFQSSNYFLLRITPTVSKTFKTQLAELTPYGGAQVSPMFQVGGADSKLGLKAVAGLETKINDWKGIRLWTELGIDVLNTINEIVFGVSYPVSLLEK